MARLCLCIVALVFSVAQSTIAEERKRDDLLSVPVGQRQLFLDDYVVASSSDLTSTMHTPEKRGAVIRPDQSWEKWLETRSVPAWNEERGVFQIWLLTNTVDINPGMTYAESVDGIHWTKPILRQRRYKGSLENNFITPDPTLNWAESIMENIVIDPIDPDPSRRYKGLMGAEYRQPIASADGIHWTILNIERIPSMDESNLSYDSEAQIFIATTKVWGRTGRCHAIWTSKDFVKWEKLEKVFSADDEDQRLAEEYILQRKANPTLQQIPHEPGKHHADVYNMGLFRYEGLYIGLPSFYYSSAGVEPHTHGFSLIQLASSRDMQTWVRQGDRQPFIGPSAVSPDVYDQTQILPPSAPVIRGDELWFYYSGLKYREEPENPDPKQGAVCLAVLRRDGFVSLDAGEKEGVLQTKPFIVTGTGLSVNADVASGGSLKIEVIDNAGKVLAVSEAITGDQPSAQVTWASGDFSVVKGTEVSLRFKLKNMQFYSFWLEE